MAKATAAESFVEIEVSGPKNEALIFAPLQRRIRGRFDLGKVAEPSARMRITDYPEAIPGQRLRLDYASGEGAVVEPLHDAKHAALREKIGKRGVRFSPACEAIDSADVATWHFWLRRAVESGHARIVAGAFAEDVPGKPKVSFITKPVESSNDKLTAALDRVGDLLAAALDRLGKQG
ncbi:MAG TPA: hypothetical protein VGN57_14095 [Pirellulaceae bacterium]|jgi:hypothetical protein|nr:hypothetical protein [Pirellulaceae bacterium]